MSVSLKALHRHKKIPGPGFSGVIAYAAYLRFKVCGAGEYIYVFQQIFKFHIQTSGVIVFIISHISVFAQHGLILINKSNFNYAPVFKLSSGGQALTVHNLLRCICNAAQRAYIKPIVG